MRRLDLVMVFAQPYISPSWLDQSPPGKMSPLERCQPTANLCALLLSSFFKDAKFVVFELQVGNVIPAGARARLLGCAPEHWESQGLPVPPLCHLCCQQQHPALLLHQHCWLCCELIQLKLAKKDDFLEGSFVQEWC